MSRLVVDASVAIKWFAVEDLRSQARILLDPRHELIALDHALVEVTSGLIRKVTRGTYSYDAFADDFEILQQSIEVIPALAFIGAAAAIAHSYGSSVYDSLYVALALQEDCRMVTADEKLITLLRPFFADSILWLGDVTADLV